MARYLISRAKGFVHDIDFLETLSSEANNIVCLSDRAMYVLQNFASLDASFLSRYGTIYDDGTYEPVEAGSPDAGLVYGTVDLIRSELSMTCLTELQRIATAVEKIANNTAGIVEKCGGAGEGQSSPSDGVVSVGGPNDQFATQSEYLAAKCATANAIYDTVYGFFVRLEASGVSDWIDGSKGGIIGLISDLMLVSGPLGWAMSKVKTFVVKVALLFLGGQVIDVQDIIDALDDVHTELVRALYNGQDTPSARGNWETELSGSSPALTSAETELVLGALTNDLVNNLFAPGVDAYQYVSASPVTCTSLNVWTFAASGDGWTFRDDSDAGGYAAGSWNSTVQAWRLSVTPNGGNGRGVIYLDGLSISVGASNSVQFDFAAPSDGLQVTIRLRVFYSDATQSDGVIGSTSSSGTIVVGTEAGKTISSIECQTGRAASSDNVPYNQDILEVRVQ